MSGTYDPPTRQTPPAPPPTNTPSNTPPAPSSGLRARIAEARKHGSRSAKPQDQAIGFVDWTQAEPGQYLEGVFLKLWQSAVNDVATFQVTFCEIPISCGRGPDKEYRYAAQGDVVNVGLGYKGLADAVLKAHEGHTMVIGFDGWEVSKKGVRYRIFLVEDLSPGSDQMEERYGGAPQDEVPF